VSTLIFSPSLMKGGTCTIRPVSSWRLGHAGGGGALQARLNFHDSQDDGLRQFDAYGFAVEKFDLDLEVRRQVFDGVAQDFAVRCVCS